MVAYERLNKAKKLINRFGGLALDLIFPVECFGCKKEGAWICPDCFRGLAYKEKQYCLGCKKENSYGEFCPVCKKEYQLDGLLIAGDYETELLAITIKNIKYHLVRDAAGYLGKYLAAFLINEINKVKISALDLAKGRIWEKLEETGRAPAAFYNLAESLIVPVPLHPKRQRARGFNQAELIGEVLARKLNLTVDKKILVRLKHKTPQAKLGEGERKKNVRDCYGFAGEGLSNRNVILIDDVATTGATLNECARVLKANGAGEVWGLVVAKG